MVTYSFIIIIIIIINYNYNYIYIYIHVMMKPPFKASDSAINVLSAPWFDMCTVWFVVSLSCINEVMKYINYVMPTRAISGL